MSISTNTEQTGKISLSFDFELGWGALESGEWKSRELKGVYTKLRPTIKELLSIFRETEISATWATVAGMIDKNSLDHLDHLPDSLRDITYYFLSNSKSSSFYGLDVFDMVAVDNLHSIASHSYSHLRFSYPGVTNKIVDTDLKLSNSIFMNNDISVDTFVFPQNIEGYYDELKINGIFKARGDEYCNRNPNKLRRIYMNTVLQPPLSQNDIVKGVFRKSGSLFYSSTSRFRVKLIEMQAMRGVNNACSSSGEFHIYLHPFNLSESDYLFSSFKSFLYYVARLRDSGKLEIVKF